MAKYPAPTHTDANGTPTAGIASGFPFHPTPCCNAAASISDGPMYCKECYEEVDDLYGGVPVAPFAPIELPAREYAIVGDLLGPLVSDVDGSVEYVCTKCGATDLSLWAEDGESAEADHWHDHYGGAEIRRARDGYHDGLPRRRFIRTDRAASSANRLILGLR